MKILPTPAHAPTLPSQAQAPAKASNNASFKRSLLDADAQLAPPVPRRARGEPAQAAPRHDAKPGKSAPPKRSQAADRNRKNASDEAASAAQEPASRASERAESAPSKSRDAADSVDCHDSAPDEPVGDETLSDAVDQAGASSQSDGAAGAGSAIAGGSDTGASSSMAPTQVLGATGELAADQSAASQVSSGQAATSPSGVSGGSGVGAGAVGSAGASETGADVTSDGQTTGFAQAKPTPTQVPLASSSAASSNLAALTPDAATAAASPTSSGLASPLTNATPEASGGAASTAQTASDVDPNVARIARGLQGALAQQGGSVTLRLNPADLGQVQIRMELQDGVVRTQFLTQHESVTALLHHEMGQLRHALESRGLVVDQLSVQTLTPTPQASSMSHQGQAGASPDDGRSRGQYAGDGSRQDKNESNGRAIADFAKELVDAVA